MVGFGHDYHETSDCPGPLCEQCRFKDELAEMIERGTSSPEHIWNKLVGGLSDRLFDAVWALHRVRREGFTTDHDEIANSWEAANKLVEVYTALDKIRDTLGIDTEKEGST